MVGGHSREACACWETTRACQRIPDHVNSDECIFFGIACDEAGVIRGLRHTIMSTSKLFGPRGQEAGCMQGNVSISRWFMLCFICTPDHNYL